MPISYKIFSPDGKLIASHDRTSLQTDSLLHVSWPPDFPERKDSRVLLMMPARHVDRSANLYSIVVVAVTFLPFK